VRMGKVMLPQDVLAVIVAVGRADNTVDMLSCRLLGIGSELRLRCVWRATLARVARHPQCRRDHSYFGLSFSFSEDFASFLEEPSFFSSFFGGVFASSGLGWALVLFAGG